MADSQSFADIGRYRGVMLEVGMVDAVRAEVDLSVACLFTHQIDGQALVGGLANLDQALGGKLTQLRAEGAFRGLPLQTLLIDRTPVDPQGRPRMVLSAAKGAPSIRLLHSDGTAQAVVSLDEAGLPSVTLCNPDPAHPTVRLEVDDKGTHLKVDHPGGSTAYLFVNNGGTCGLVLADEQGERKGDIKAPARGEAVAHPLDEAGKPRA